MIHKKEFSLNDVPYTLVVEGDTQKVFDKDGVVNWSDDVLSAATTVGHIAGFFKIYGTTGIIGIWIPGLTFSL